MTEPRDARSLDHATLEEMRRLAVSRIVAGESQREVARSLQVHRCTAAKWMIAYRQDGEEGLASSRASGRSPTLSPRQMDRLKRVIVGKNPQQLNFGPALWTLPLVGDLIERLFRVLLHKATIGRILHRLGLTPQKPVRRAFKRDEAECRHWMTREFPRIVREAKKRQSTLLFVDETGVHEDGPIGRTWGTKGQTPVVRVSGTRRRVNVISAVSPRGQLWFRCYFGTLTAPRFLGFLKGLRQDFRKPLDVIMDRHPAHEAAMVKTWVRDQDRRVRVHSLPAYAPDLNPDEHVWTQLKGMFRRDPVHRDEDFTKAVRLSMQELRNDKALVKAFFGHPAVAYVREALGW